MGIRDKITCSYHEFVDLPAYLARKVLNSEVKGRIYLY